jgi:hypothetical protein
MPTNNSKTIKDNKKDEPSKVTKETKETKETKKEEPSKVIKETKNEEPSKDVKETKKDESKNEKVKKTVSKKIEMEVEIDDSDDDENENDNEEQEGDEAKEEEDEKNLSKEKKAKKSFQELFNDFEKLSTDIKSVDAEVSEMEKNLKMKVKQKYDLERQRSKVFAQLGKSHEEDVKKALKEKPKRKGNKDGGFNKEVPVPPKLIKFLDLEDDVKMSRPKVMSLLNDKFKLLKLKEGQSTTLDKDTAKYLGKEKGRVIEFTAFQSFLKEFYDEAFANVQSTTVEL